MTRAGEGAVSGARQSLSSHLLTLERAFVYRPIEASTPQSWRVYVAALLLLFSHQGSFALLSQQVRVSVYSGEVQHVT